jgi:hypothetical protein
VPSRVHIPARLHTHIRIVCDMMLKTHYFDEAHWLWMAVGSPQLCQTPGGQQALRSAMKIAGEFGFADVASWIASTVLQAAGPAGV